MIIKSDKKLSRSADHLQVEKMKQGAAFFIECV